MLKKFFLNALSSFVGTWVAMVLFGVAMLFLCIGIATRVGSVSGTVSKPGSLLRLTLQGEIVETEVSRDFDPQSLLMNRDIRRPTPLNILVEGLREAKTNKSIKALYIECKGVSASPATLNALLEAVKDFKTSGKKVYAYGDALSQGDYYIASAADSLFMNPQGELDLHGITGVSLYFKELFDKLGVNFAVCKVGTFKSAVEPYTQTSMSDPARAQLDTLYGNMWRYIKANIAANRKLKTSQIDSLMNRGMISLMPASEIVKAKLVDRLAYGREMKAVLGRVSGQDPEKLSFTDIEELISSTNWQAAYTSKRQVAVLYATGEIAEGTGSGIDCDKLVPEIVKLADDDHIKGLVLRVNSPGGSVFGSDQIGDALAYFKSKGKPFAVSMGDYAASGGYWISCEADRIYADPLTITGSIGIFGLFPNISGLLEKIGVSPQEVSTNPDASMPTPLTRLSESQHHQLQAYVERGYKQFTDRVAKGRKMPLSKVLGIAEGRVWDGQTAKRIGLVDQLGSLLDATEWVATRAKLEDNYDVGVYPRFEPSFWDMIPLGETLGIADCLESYLKANEPQREVMTQGIRILERKPLQARSLEIKIKL